MPWIGASVPAPVELVVGLVDLQEGDEADRGLRVRCLQGLEEALQVHCALIVERAGSTSLLITAIAM